jgi:hypothetical protein
MRKNTIVLIIVLIALAGAYAYWFTEWFLPPTVEILAQVRPSRSSRRPTPNQPTTYPVSFAFDRKLRLTEVKVVAVSDEATNKYPHALWHLITDSNSAPVKAIVYGERLRGMKPKVPRARPDPLEADVKYRLYVTAGKLKGQRDFKTIETAEAPQ